eukprot:12909803-Prorocentrum_lima.AAC.1
MTELSGNLGVQLFCGRPSLPEYIVANCYFSRTQYIGEHIDDHELFQTRQNPAVILSCNVRHDT